MRHHADGWHPVARPPRRCVYCGARIDYRATACRQHGYLLRLDWRFLGDLVSRPMHAAPKREDAQPTWEREGC